MVLRAPAQHGTLKPNLDKVKSDFNAKEQGEFVDKQKGPVVDLARRADEFIKDVEKGGKDGYFVSSKCLLRLEESQRQSLMSILWEAGYSEIYQTNSTTLFARIKNNEENRTTYCGASSAFKEKLLSHGDMDEIGPSKGDDDFLGSAGTGVNLSRSSNNVADFFDSNNPVGTSSMRSFEEEMSPAVDPLETGMLSREDGFESQLCQNVTTEMLEPTPTPTVERIEHKQQTSFRAMSTNPPTRINISPAEQQADTLRSFKAALMSKSYPSFRVSTRWLSDLTDHEQKALSAILEAGYKKIHETSTGTWYERLGVRMQSPGDGGLGDDSSSSSKRSDVAGGNITKSSASKSDDSLASRKGKRNVNDDDTTASHALDTMESERNEDKSVPCHPQRLRVASSARPSSVLPSSRDEIVEQHVDEEIVRLPNLRGRAVKLISTSIDRRFSIPAIHFSDEGYTMAVTKSMNAKARSSLSCCLDPHQSKVRIKFSQISGEIKDKDSNEQTSYLAVLSCLGTTVYGCTRRTDDEDDLEQIGLNLDDVYHNPRGRAVVQTRASDIDLVWLGISSSHANNSKNGSVTVELRAAVNERLADDLATNVPRAHTLSFNNVGCPVIFEGGIDEERRRETFLDLEVRYKLEVTVWSEATRP